MIIICRNHLGKPILQKLDLIIWLLVLFRILLKGVILLILIKLLRKLFKNVRKIKNLVLSSGIKHGLIKLYRISN